ncbi:hypothetical protein PGH12_15020 [Chryseobacterium wangxinyae]|uniref:hypothetical protein n=1 Tax=Chryseobacterium sp. CY350 TaxID=2997336 RepID=UPI002270C3F1|nr:hypothetical protein [Chryseobacterium sp. CY350]MCY0979198.1 hypothetical protein [Chryseobacterium sp. CY350]WBZ94771.1 hypothetical protein PGH12_15020 [Chryseobacterium sp. CY350]
MKARFFLCLMTAAALVFSCKSDDEEIVPHPEAFTYSAVTGMSTGNSSVAGTAAPAGYSWSEVKAPQSTWGLNGTMGDRMLTDDFQVPSGEKWNVQNLYFYSYQTGFSGTTFPVSEFYFEIYSSDPSVAGAVKIYGDTTTNRYISSEETKWYRILQGQTDNTSRKIYKMKINSPDLNLASGNYWIKWGSKTSSGSHFYPQFPHDASKVNNAQQFVVASSTWVNLDDGGQRVSFPFEISGTKLPN